jgi:hypothetical protein
MDFCGPCGHPHPFDSIFKEINIFAAGFHY